VSELDWAALQKDAASVKPIPDGDYNALIVEAEAVSSSNGKPMVKTKFRIVDGPQKDKKVSTQFVISAESAVALKIFFQHMAALGLNADFFAGNPSMDAVARAMVNRGCQVTIGTRPWQGVDRNEIKNIRPFPEGTPTPPGMVTGGAVAGPSPTSSPSPLDGLAATPVAAPVATPTGAVAPPTSPF
jgi:hypothetical protein